MESVPINFATMGIWVVAGPLLGRLIQWLAVVRAEMEPLLVNIAAMAVWVIAGAALGRLIQWLAVVRPEKEPLAVCRAQRSRHSCCAGYRHSHR